MVKLTYKLFQEVFFMTSLKELLYVILKSSGINIYIQDLSGIFSNPLCDVDTVNKSYHSPMNDFLEKNPVCTECRKKSLQKSAYIQSAFIEKRPCGMSEAVYPVVIDGKTKCIIYAENFSDKSEEDFEHLKDLCADELVFENAKVILENSEAKDDVFKILEIISSYITLLFNNFSFAEEKSEENSSHWVVINLKNHIEKEYFKDINLKQLALLYGYNEKYLGRIFKKETGLTFHEYLNEIRLEKATEMLINTEDSVILISKKCGFNNVTYFNRIFLKKFEKTPLEFKNSKSNRFWDRHSYLL